MQRAIAWAAAWVASESLAFSTAYVWSKTILSDKDCARLISLAHAQGLRPSFSKERALQSLLFHARRTFGLHDFDVDGSGDLNIWEVTAAAQTLLNAPLFSAQDAKAWVLASTGKVNLSLSWPAEEHLKSLLSSSGEVFARILAHHPEKLTRHSFQAPLLWEQARSLSVQLGTVAEELVGRSLWNELHLEAEPVQVISYPKNGHYALHSDACAQVCRVEPTVLLVVIFWHVNLQEIRAACTKSGSWYC